MVLLRIIWEHKGTQNIPRKVERKNIKEEGKEGRWENEKKICFSSLTHTHLCLRHGAHTSHTFYKAFETRGVSHYGLAIIYI